MKNNKALFILGIIIVILLVFSQLLPILIKKDNNKRFLLPESDEVIDTFNQRAYVHLSDLEVTVRSNGYVDSEVYEEILCESCLLSDIKVSEGDYVYKNDILFKDITAEYKAKVTKIEYNENDKQYKVILKNLETLSAIFYIDQKDAEKVDIGQNTTIYYNDLIFNGKITSIAEEFSSGRLLIKSSIDNDDEHILRVNALVNISVKVYTKKDVLVVTKYAVYYINDEAYVNLLVKGEDGIDKIVSTKIVIGIEGDYFVQIISGVKRGDLVVFSIDNKVGENYD